EIDISIGCVENDMKHERPSSRYKLLEFCSIDQSGKHTGREISVGAKGAERNGQGVIRDHLRDLRWEDETPRHGYLIRLQRGGGVEEEGEGEGEEGRRGGGGEDGERVQQRLLLPRIGRNIVQLEVEWLLMRRQQGKEKKVGDWPAPASDYTTTFEDQNSVRIIKILRLVEEEEEEEKEKEEEEAKEGRKEEEEEEEEKEKGGEEEGDRKGRQWRRSRFCGEDNDDDVSRM
ncbi:hypothetical protein V1477_000474, partial [Vespula maculifrons]